MGDKVRFFGPWQRLTAQLWLLALVALLFADIEVISVDPWAELSRLALGVISPDFFATEFLLSALWQTVNFALLGVAFGIVLGGPLALVYQHPFVAASCAMVRGVHELFWALLFLQIFGLSPLTGILAIGLPYGATFARVFHDILAQSPSTTERGLPFNTDPLSRYVYGRLGHVYPLMLAYIRYRFECALRSSAVLGFIGMPTLGFYLETAFRQGQYSEGAALLMLFILLIGTISFWAKKTLIPVYLLAALWTIPDIGTIDGGLLWRFVSYDLLPPGIQGVIYTQMELSDGLNQFYQWLASITINQALPGVFATVILALSALGLSHFVALIAHLVASQHSGSKYRAVAGQLGLLVLRSIPEYILAFVLMLLIGPSMLPAIIALALHNGALIAFLLVKQEQGITPSATYKKRADFFAYEILTRVYPNLMGLLFYRFEVMLRETAIFGILGVATIGFYIDSAFAEIRYSNALYLLAVTALLNVVIDFSARKLVARQVGDSIAHGRSCIT